MARPRNKRASRSARSRSTQAAKAPARQGPVVAQAQPTVTPASESASPEVLVEDTPAVATGEGPTVEAETAAPQPATSRAGSFLPRRRDPPAPARPQAAVVAPSAPAATSLLPRKVATKAAGPAGRAEQRRRQEAALEPLDESAAVPMDRTPYLRLDINRVIFTSVVMLVVIVLGWIFIH